MSTIKSYTVYLDGRPLGICEGTSYRDMWNTAAAYWLREQSPDAPPLHKSRYTALLRRCWACNGALNLDNEYGTLDQEPAHVDPRICHEAMDGREIRALSR